MKKFVFILSIILAIGFFTFKCKENGSMYYISSLFVQSLENKDYNFDHDILSHTAKILYSYNPPKAYLAIFVVSAILFFVIYKKYTVESLGLETLL